MDSSLTDLLPTLVRPDKIARYENGMVFIGDRRKYPFEFSWYRCEDVEEVAQAIEQMVTQGAGPRFAGAFGLASAAHKAQTKKPAQVIKILHAARDRLVATRPTNTTLSRLLTRLMDIAEHALTEGRPAEAAILAEIEAYTTESLDRALKMAQYGADLIEDGDGILTMCFAEEPFLMSLAIAQRHHGKKLEVYVPETRPYLQGARLTAPSIEELAIPVKLITDGMPAHLMAQGKIQKFMSGTDLVTLDGHVANKIGTYQNAVNAYHHGIPYFPFSRGPDRNRPDKGSIKVEERDPQEIKEFRGVATTLPQIGAYYPAFDITPPHLVSGVVTELGILSPYDLKRYFG